MNSRIIRSLSGLLPHRYPKPGLVLLAIAIAWPQVLRAQVPSLLWTNAAAGRVFAVDQQTNVYASLNGIITKLNRDGVPLQTNTLSPHQGVAQRDAAGNYYFAGTPYGFIPGGIFISNPPCFLAKFDSAGAMIWSNSFGPTNIILRRMEIQDLALDADGNLYAGYSYAPSTINHNSTVDKFDASGSNVWLTIMPKGGLTPNTLGSVRLGLVYPTNGYVVTYVESAFWQGTLSQFDGSGTPTVLATWYGPQSVSAPLIMNPGVEFYTTETSSMFGGPSVLTKRNSSGSILWASNIGGTQATVGRDAYGGVHVADTVDQLARYDSDGNPVWTMTLPTACKELFLDASGNRFISLANNTIGRLSGEILTAPAITNAPQGSTVMASSNAVMTVGASGSTPLRYFWIFNGSTVSTNKTLNLTNVSTSQAGPYVVIVSNLVGSVTSAPALLVVKRVAIFVGNQLLTNGTYNFGTNPILSIRSTFPSGSSFYTLDGSAPSFSSTPYENPFTLTQGSTVRAIGYSADFLQSEEADAVTIIVPGQHTLTATSPGGGSVNLNPPGGIYVSTNVVTATAVTLPGWSFLYWKGDAAGTNPTVNISMERDKAIQAIFGTTLSTTVSGSGQIVVQPARALYPYGEVVRLTGVPQPGNYFGFWGNAATGNTNPLYFAMTVTNPTVSSIFGAVPSGQAALTILINGNGRVDVNPRANVYPTNQSVTLTAIPDAGRTFVNWSGSASGTQNPLIVQMNQDRLINAYFHGAPALSLNRTGSEGLSSQGFRLTILGDFPYAYQVFGSSNLVNWQGLGVVTNATGEVLFLDSSATSSPLKFYRAAPVP